MHNTLSESRKSEVAEKKKKRKKEKLWNDFNFQISQESLYKIPISKKKVIQGTEYPHNFNTVTVNAYFTMNNLPQILWAPIELRIISVNVLNIKLEINLFVHVISSWTL